VKRVLITGGAGFIGYHLAHELVSNGYAVDLWDNFSRAVLDPDFEALSRHPNVRVLRGNLVDPELTSSLKADYHHIYHFAAIIGVAHVLERPYAVLTENVALLVRALEIARQQTRLERFVFASTSEVYAGTLAHFDLPVPTPETVPLAVTDVSHARASYMLSKIYGEALCQHASVPFTIIRPHNFYGPRMGLSHVVPELLKKAHFAAPGESLEVASPGHRRAFCYISDAVRMTRLLAESPQALNQTLNVGNQDQELSIGELAEIVVSTVGRPIGVRALADTPGSPTRRCPDISRAIAMTNYTPEVVLREGVALTYTWYRERIFEGKQLSAR
jgi:UDP-glucuronate decarboxylase